MKDNLLRLILISLAIASWQISGASEEITPAELAILLAAFALVLAVQSVALWMAARWTGERTLAVLVALFIALNAYHFAFLTLEAKTVVRVLLAAGVGGAVLALSRSGWPSAPQHIFALVFSVLSLGNYGWGRATFVEDAAIEPASAQTTAVASKRNVYLISMESLPSLHALRSLYGIDAASHVDYLKTEGFRVFDRAYSVSTTTRAAYQGIMEFSKPLSSRDEMSRVFRTGNSTFTSFRRGGYGIQFIYVNNHMNMNPKLVDHLFPRVGFYVCDNVPNNFFYFVCRRGPRSLINKYLYGVSHRIEVPDQIAHLKERIAAIKADDKPWLTISHIAFPEHTKKTHRYDDASDVKKFRALVRGFLPQIEQNYRELVTTIKQHDPGAVIVTFGDHGAWLTRGMDFATPNPVFDKEDYIEDLYGVMLAVYPADFCQNRIFEGSSTRFLLKNLIECLNGNDDPAPEDLEQSRAIFFQGNYTDPGKFAAPQ